MGQGSGSNIVTTGTKRCPYCGEEIKVTDNFGHVYTEEMKRPKAFNVNIR